jgi:phosphate uptake regulator
MRRILSRKLQSTRSSFVVSIPRDWVLKNSLKAGDDILLLVNDKKIVIVNSQLAEKIKNELNSKYLT